MKILWIADFGIQHNLGGAQRSDSILMAAGRSRGHDITCFHFDSDPAILNLHYDLIITSNLESLCNRFPHIIQWIVAQASHIRVEHDSNRYLTPEARRLLFGSCSKTFFLTNFHYNQFKAHYGDIFQNVEIVPDPIDTDVFYNSERERSTDILYVGFMHELKGTRDFFMTVINSPDENFVVAGWGDSIFEHCANSLDNVEFLGRIDHDKMPALYNKYSRMYYKPAYYEPFCRSVGEALLCGTEILGNNLIGCIHYMQEVGQEEFRTQCGAAPQTFWNKINESV